MCKNLILWTDKSMYFAGIFSLFLRILATHFNDFKLFLKIIYKFISHMRAAYPGVVQETHIPQLSQKRDI